ncbi:hypothetical protein CYMTET_31148, partial [Cymbomonas tetramitiformis]
ASTNGPWEEMEVGEKSVQCASLVCYNCFCEQRGWRAYSADEDELGSFCKDYWTAWYFQLSIEAGTLVVVAAADYLLMEVMRRLANFEKHKTRSELETSVAMRVFVVLTINNAVVTVLMHARVHGLDWIPILFKGSFKDFAVEWYGRVGGELLFTTVINVFSWPLREPIMAGMGWLRARLCTPFRRTQESLNKLWEPPEFLLAERTGQMMSAVFLSLLFCAGIPLLVPMFAVYVVLQYLSDKYMLLRVCKRPPCYGMAIANAVLRVLPYAPLAHLATAIWMFTHEEIYSPSVGRSSPLFTDTWDRLRQYTVLPMMAALALIAGAMTLIDQWTNTVRFVQFLVTGKYSTELEGDPPFSTAKREGMLGGLQSYAMAENPQYAAWMRDGPESIPGQALQRVEVPRWRATTILAMKCRAGRAPISTEHYSAASGVQYSPSRRTAQPPDEDAWKVSPAKYAIL